MPCPRKVVPLRRADPHADAAALDDGGDASPTEPGGPQPAPASLWHAHCFAPPMPPPELHLRAVARGKGERGEPAGVWPRARRRERAVRTPQAGEPCERRHERVGPRASGGLTGYPPVSARPQCGGAPAAQRCARPPLCQPRQRAGGMQSRWEVTARSKGAAGARRKTDGKWRCPRPAPSRCALRDGLAQTRTCRGGAVTRPAEIAATAASGDEDGWA